MGAGQTKPEERSRSQHHRMANYRMMRDSEDRERKLMEVDCPVGSQSEIAYWEGQLREISAISRQSGSAQFLPLQYRLVQEGMCGTSGTLKVCLRLRQMTFDFYPYILSEEIHSRVELNTPFNEQELWYLLYEIVCASKDYEKMNMKSGDVRPRNIVINENGQIRLVSRCSFPNELANYGKAFESKEPGYLSPEELTEIEKRTVHPVSDPVLAESFSIGLTILDAALLFDSETLYEMHYIGFKAHIFNENVYKWKTSQYSPFLIKTVENMLEVNHIERPTPGEVYAILHPYENEIRNLDPFVPDKELSRQSLEVYQRSMRNRTLLTAQRSIKPLGNRSSGVKESSGTPRSALQPIKFPQMPTTEGRRGTEQSVLSLSSKTVRIVPNSSAYLHNEGYPTSPTRPNQTEKSRW